MSLTISYEFLYVLFGIILEYFYRVGAFDNCPKYCFCNELSMIVYCSRKGLSSIPLGIPNDALQLNLNGNAFKATTISKANFSHLSALEHLYLSECNIEVIEVGTFSDLIHLKWLDLTFNQIKEIFDFTFSGVHLQHLFLNGNRNIIIKTNSFAGLDTNGLYLHDCLLRHISPEVLLPLNLSLQYLWLNGNQLEVLDNQFLPLFQRLSHIRLGANPFHCNCEVVWIKEFYDKNGEIFAGNNGAPPPSCLTPKKLRGKYFNSLSLFDFSCQPPVFNNIDAMFNDTVGKLRCTATGDPAPTLFWIQPSGESKKFLPPESEEITVNEAILYVSSLEIKQHISGMYICLALNEAGNVTLTLNITWPGRTVTHIPQLTTVTELKIKSENVITDLPLIRDSEKIKIHPTPVYSTQKTDCCPQTTRNKTFNLQKKFILTDTYKKYLMGDVPSSISNEQNVDSVNVEYHPTGGYDLIQLIGAVIGTHVITLILCFVFIPICLKRQWKRKRCRQNHKKYPSRPYLNGAGRLDYIDLPMPKRI